MNEKLHLLQRRSFKAYAHGNWVQFFAIAITYTVSYINLLFQFFCFSLATFSSCCNDLRSLRLVQIRLCIGSSSDPYHHLQCSFDWSFFQVDLRAQREQVRWEHTSLAYSFANFRWLWVYFVCFRKYFRCTMFLFCISRRSLSVHLRVEDVVLNFFELFWIFREQQDESRWLQCVSRPASSE